MEKIFLTENKETIAMVREELELELRPIEQYNEDEEIEMTDPFNPEEISIDTK